MHDLSLPQASAVQRTRPMRWRILAALLAVVLIQGLWIGQARAAAALTVSEALGSQNGTEGTVSGYIVGQPVSSSTVVTSDFPNDYAIALADSADETDPANMLYVQVGGDFRSEWGLASNADKLGSQVSVTGTLAAYFSHGGMKSLTDVTAGDEGEDPEEPTDPPEDPEEPTDPPENPSDPGDYYADAEGKSGDELKSALNTIISDQTKISYADVWDALQLTDEDPNNASNVVLLYSGRSQAKSAHGGDQDDWNREHVWAKSHGDFGTTIGAGTDVHHLRPTDTTVNSTRGNKDFDNGGEPVPEAEDCLTDSDSWEPRDEVKGDVARMIFYMAVRYEGANGEPDLEVNDKVDNGSDPFMGKVSVLKEWNEADPVDAFEANRNEVIFSEIQHNRNPFIDHPEWVNEIWN